MSGSAAFDVLASPWWIPQDDDMALYPRASLFLQKQNMFAAVPFHLPEKSQTCSERTQIVIHHSGFS